MIIFTRIIFSLGGRVNTAKFANGGTCELGAEWLAGGDISNGLILLANQEGLGSKVDWRYNRNIVCMTSEGRALSSDICFIGRKIFNKVRREAYRLFKVAADIKHGTVAYFLDRRLGEELKSFGDCWRDALQRLMCCLKNDLRVRWGAELGKMSSDLLGTYAEEPANALRLHAGLVNVLLPLVRDIPQDKIHLNSPVKTIFWEHDKTSVVLESSKEVPVDFIIVTVPLGFLKKNCDTFFHPKLPKAKLEAIEKLGYGKVTKIYMKYPFDIWGSRRTEISTLWKSRDWSDREMYWYKGISCVHVQRDMAAVVIGGKEAECAENESSDLIAHDLTSLLRCFLSAAFLPQPNELLKSRWNTDIWNLGSGTYLSLDSRPSDPATLAAPLFICADKNPKILFAGEATCPKNLNTVHGARKTGIREAQRILDMVSNTALADRCPC